MLSKILRVSICACSFLYTFSIVCSFMYFLSKQNEHQKSVSRSDLGENLVLTTLWTLLVDTCLLSAFVLQHSLMASDFVKRIYKKLKIQDLERSVYNASSAGVLHLLIREWQPVPWVTLWNINTFQNNKLWIAIGAVHFLGWFIIYSGCLMMDISELAGLKQVYYQISGRPWPMSMKSEKLQRYFSHMRHPSFIGFLLIFWIHPFMSIDRLLFSSLLTTYMVMMWSIDQDDYNYHSVTIACKQRELS